MKIITKISIAMFAVCFASSAFAAAKYASVGSKEVNIRKCASTKCAVKFKAWKYTPLEMIGVSKDKQWVEIKDFEGFKGWIHKDLLAETPGLSAKSDVNVRTSPSANAAVAWVVEKGFPLKFIKKQGAWYQVADDDGTKGWVSASVVWGFTEYSK